MPRAARHVSTALLSAASLVACASEPAAALEWRVLVKLAQPSDDNGLIARRAGQASGVPVRYLASVSLQWHGLGLACGDEPRCADALQRLRADPFFISVERDERRRPHANNPL